MSDKDDKVSDHTIYRGVGLPPEEPESDSDNEPTLDFNYAFTTRMLSYAATPPDLPQTKMLTRPEQPPAPARPSISVGAATRMLSSPVHPYGLTMRMASHASLPSAATRPKTGLTFASFPVKFIFMEGTEWYPISNAAGWFCDKCRKHPSAGRRFACGDPSLDLDLCEDCVIDIAPEQLLDAVRKEMTSLTRMYKASKDKVAEKMEAERLEFEAITFSDPPTKASTGNSV